MQNSIYKIPLGNSASEKISLNRSRMKSSADQDGRQKGQLTDGETLRWHYQLQKQELRARTDQFLRSKSGSQLLVIPPHNRLKIGDFFWCTAGHHFMTIGSDENIVLNADSDSAQLSRRAQIIFGNVKARLNGE
jgi:hypothetical protein